MVYNYKRNSSLKEELRNLSGKGLMSPNKGLKGPLRVSCELQGSDGSALLFGPDGSRKCLMSYEGLMG